MMSSSQDTPSLAVLLSELTQQLHLFFHHLDEYRYDDMLAMFTRDGRWFRQGQALNGHVAIREALARRPRGQRIRHVMSNAFIAERAADRVRLEAYMTAYRHEQPTAGEVPVIPGPFRLNLVSTIFTPVQQQWRIAEQSMVPEFIIQPAH